MSHQKVGTDVPGVCWLTRAQTLVAVSELGVCCPVDTHTVCRGEERGFVFGSVERSGNPSTSSLSWVLRPWLLYPCLPTANRVSLLVREYRRIKGLAVPAVHLHGEAGARGVQGPLLSGQLAAACPAGGTSQFTAAVTAGLSPGRVLHLGLFLEQGESCLPPLPGSTFPFFQDLGREKGSVGWNPLGDPAGSFHCLQARGPSVRRF